MYKMKDVCNMTGLTEKAIRLYMEKKLVEPKVEEGIHRNSYYFSEDDVIRLKDIATLRSAGFGLADIKMMIEDPTNISSLVDERESLLKREIEQMKSLRRSMNNLTIEEHSDLTKLSEAIETRLPKEKYPRWVKQVLLILALLAVLSIPMIIVGKQMIYSLIFAICLVYGPVAIWGGIRYLLHASKGLKAEYSGIGNVVGVITNEHIEDFVLQEGEKGENDYPVMPLFGMSEKALWNRIRLDCWYPVIRYKTEEGKHQIATVRYGAFKNQWKIGSAVLISWNEEQKKVVYEKERKIIRKNALRYLISGIIMFIVAISIFIYEASHIVFLGR